MTTATIPAALLTSEPSYPMWRLFTGAEYQRLGEIGVLRPNEPLDLIEGAIIQRFDQRQQRLFTVAEYDCMIATGILRDDERVELIAGEIVQMCPLGSRHAVCVDKVSQLLIRQVTEAINVRVQGPLRLTDTWEPQPDILVLKDPADDYTASLPTPADVLLLIEVSDSTLAYDRYTKQAMYAQHGIRELWIVNLVSDILEIYTQPADGTYSMVRVAQRGETVQPTLLPAVMLPVAAMLLLPGG